MNIGSYSYEDYVHLVEFFSRQSGAGAAHRGLYRRSGPEKPAAGEFFDAICETSICLPDAVQLLTPCTIGNGWVEDLRRRPLCRDPVRKRKWRGKIRVHLDSEKLKPWPEFNAWYFRAEKEKKNRISSSLSTRSRTPAPLSSACNRSGSNRNLRLSGAWDPPSSVPPAASLTP